MLIIKSSAEDGKLVYKYVFARKWLYRGIVEKTYDKSYETIWNMKGIQKYLMYNSPLFWVVSTRHRSGCF